MNARKQTDSSCHPKRCKIIVLGLKTKKNTKFFRNSLIIQLHGLRICNEMKQKRESELVFFGTVRIDLDDVLSSQIVEGGGERGERKSRKT